MATVGSINTAILAALAADVSYIDETSADNFLPTVTTEAAALLAVPQGQRDEMAMLTLTKLGSIHRLRFELWIKHVKGQPATTTQRAREFGIDAASILFAGDGGDWEIAPETEIVYEVDEFFTEINGVSWLVGTLFVSVWNVETV